MKYDKSKIRVIKRGQSMPDREPFTADCSPCEPVLGGIEQLRSDVALKQRSVVNEDECLRTWARLFKDAYGIGGQQ